MKNIWRIIQFIPEYRGRVIGVIAVGTVLGLIGTTTPYLYKLIVDDIARLLSGTLSREQASHNLALVLLAFLALRLGVVGFGAVQNRQADRLWLDTVSTFRQRVFDNMMRKSIDYFEKTQVGEIMDRFGSITNITMWLSSLTDGTLASLLQMLFVISVLLVKAPLIGGLMACALLLNFWISWRTVGWTRPYRRGWQVLAGRMSGQLAEMIGNIATVRSFGAEPGIKQRYDDTQAQWLVARGNLHRTEWRSEQALNVINTFSVFSAVCLGTWGALQGQFSAGDILLILTLTQTLINSIAPIARQINQASEVESSAERLVQLLEVADAQADRPGAVALEQIHSITFENVSFHYPGHAQAALRDVDFHLPAGHTLALVGSSGSGKSTIAKLLMRFYDPSKGRILINGIDLRDYQQRSLRAQLGVVLQDVALFNDSIGENIAFARPGASAAQVQAAAHTAQADGFIQRLAEGYATLVGERGVRLSGGEKQRVAIARALLRDPQLIILDEATSALDSESEHQVQQSLERLMHGRTCVVIAHRLSTVMNASLILVMRNGQIIERGQHASLARQHGGLYARLFALQSQGPKVTG